MVKISEITHAGGMPAMDGATINFGNIAVSLNKDDYAELVAEIGEKAAADLKAAQAVYEKHWERVKAVSDLTTSIRDIFFDGGEDDDYFIKRCRDEIDFDKLDKILKQHNRLLGFD